MEYAFSCQHCGSRLVTQYLDPGEGALCRACGKETPVPTSSAPVPTSSAPVPTGSSGSEVPHDDRARTEQTRSGSSPLPPSSPASRAPGPPTSAPEQISVSRIISQTFRSIFGDLPHLLVLAVAGLLPWILFLLYITLVVPAPPGGLVDIVDSLFNALISPFATALVVSRVSERLRGRIPGTPEQFRVAARRYPVVLLTAWMTSFLIGIGSVLLVVPGIYASIVLYVAIPTAVLEGAGPLESLRRSSELTRGNRGKVFLLSVATVLFQAVVFGIPTVALVAAELRVGDGGDTATALSSAAGIAIAVALVITSSAVATVAYHELRQTRGDLDDDTILAVFE